MIFNNQALKTCIIKGKIWQNIMTKPTKWYVCPVKTKSAWASAQSDQSLRYPHEESLGP